MDRTRYEVAETNEFEEEGARVIVEIEGHEIAVFYYDQDYYAVANFCPHQAGSLCEGALTGQTELGDDGWGWEYNDDERYIACPWHNWMFDITTGKSAHYDRYAVPTYETEVSDESVYVLR